MSTESLAIDYERIGELLNSVHALDNSENLVRRAANRLLHLLAKTYWRDDPIELERALSYELTGRGSSEEASRLLGGQQPWSAQEADWLCKKYRVDATYFTKDLAQEPPAQTQKASQSIDPPAPTNVSKVSVFGGLSRRPVQAELELGIPPRAGQGKAVRVA